MPFVRSNPELLIGVVDWLIFVINYPKAKRLTFGNLFLGSVQFHLRIGRRAIPFGMQHHQRKSSQANTRCIRGWHLSRSLDLSLTLVALERALKEHTPEIHHSDQGLHYAAPAYVTRLEKQGVQLSMAEVGAAWQNGYAERLMGTIKEEEVELSEYHDFDDAYAQLGHFLDEVYLRKRIHSSLGYLTPTEFETQWRAQH